MKTVTGFKAINEALLSGKTLYDEYEGMYFKIENDSVTSWANKSNGKTNLHSISFSRKKEIIEDEPELYYHWPYSSNGRFLVTKLSKANETNEGHIILKSLPAFDDQGNEHTYNKETKKWERFE